MTYHTLYTESRLWEIYQILYTTLGPSGWWPARSPLEVVIGAILTQNTAWTNVEKALNNIKNHALFSDALGNAPTFQTTPATDAFMGNALLEMDTDILADMLRPSGFFKLKTQRLVSVLQYLKKRCHFDLQTLGADQSISTDTLRFELLQLNGVGPETADSILLYALQRPTFVVDAYTMRLLKRHALLPLAADYEIVRSMFMTNLPQDVTIYNEYHALIVRLCKNYCVAKRPACMRCPLGVAPKRILSVFDFSALAEQNDQVFYLN